MHFLNVLPLALSASAFLIPTEINEHVAITNKIPESATAETIQLECDGGCPVAVGRGNVRGMPSFIWSNPGDAKLEADIKVQGDKVLFNGQQIWPKSIAPPLSIKQAVSDNTPAVKGLMPLSTSLEYKQDEILVDQHTNMKIHPITIEILAVADKVVHAETVEIRVAETEAGVGLLPSRIRAYQASPYTDACKNVWCRVRGTIAEKFSQWRQATTNKINKWRGCHKGRPSHLMNGLPLKGGPAKFGPGSTLRPHGGFKGHHDGHHHGHHHGHRFGFIRHLFHTFIVGIAAGAMIGTVSFLLVSSIRRLRARSQAQYIVVEQIEIEEGRASVDGPPKYEEVYREPQPAAEDEKKELLQ